MAVCGSFRRDPTGLRAVLRTLFDCGCLVLSPRDPDFVLEERGFVMAAGELHRQPREIEDDHLRAMQAADFVWLHAPDGYIGRSASMELGFAHALGLPVFVSTPPDDPALETFVRVVRGPREALTELETASLDAPTQSLSTLQEYYRRVALERGWDQEGPEDCLVLLSEELAELKRAIRQPTRDLEGVYAKDAAGGELADVQLYVVHMANALGLDLGEAVLIKERVNARRFPQVSSEGVR